MLITLLSLLLISNAVSLTQDKSILFSRIAMVSLTLTSYLAYNNLFVTALDKGIGVYNGLFHITAFTQTFNIFIILISATVLTLTSYYPRKLYLEYYSHLTKILCHVFSYYETKSNNKMGQQFKILEYSLIIVFVLTKPVFLMSASDLVSIFLAMELHIHGLYITSTLIKQVIILYHTIISLNYLKYSTYALLGLTNIIFEVTDVFELDSSITFYSVIWWFVLPCIQKFVIKLSVIGLLHIKYKYFKSVTIITAMFTHALVPLVISLENLILPGIPEVIDPIYVPENISEWGQISAALILLGILFYDLNKNLKKAPKPDLIMQLMCTSIKQNNRVHVGIIDLNDRTGENLKFIIGLEYARSRYVTFVTPLGRYVGVIFYTLVSRQEYDESIDGVNPLSTRTHFYRNFPVSPEKLQYLHNSYNFIMYTGIGPDRIIIEPEFDGEPESSSLMINVAAAPILYRFDGYARA